MWKSETVSNKTFQHLILGCKAWAVMDHSVTKVMVEDERSRNDGGGCP